MHRYWWLAAVLLCGCLSPLRCEGSTPRDLGAVTRYDLSAGELGRPPGNACTSVDQCDRLSADTCNGRCQCGLENPCVSGMCCGGRCVDTTSDADNCGACGIQCPSRSCVNGSDGAHCTCDADAGTGCASALEPTCSASGTCTCGGQAGVCGPPVADTCGAGGCECNGGPACSGLSDHCDPVLGCRCGTEAACDPKLATACDPQASDTPCRCASGPGCSAGTFCCTQTTTCCQPNQYCCLDGCCDQPCLLLGFCH